MRSSKPPVANVAPGGAHSVKNVGERDWAATCDHGATVWTVHRSTEYLARRSLAAHVQGEDHAARAGK
jgi:hypothetical protein